MSQQKIAVPAEYQESVNNVLEVEGGSLEQIIAKLLKGYFSKLTESGFKVRANEFFKVIKVMDKTGLNPFNGEIYPVVTPTGTVKNIATLEGWLKIGQSKNITNVHFQYSDTMESVETNNKSLKVHSWIEATATCDETTVTMREFMSESFDKFSDAWLKPNSRLRYLALTQCYRVLFGIHEIADQHEVMQQGNLAINNSLDSHHENLKANSAKVDQAIIEEVDATEDAISEKGSADVDAKPENVTVEEVVTEEPQIETEVKAEETKVEEVAISEPVTPKPKASTTPTQAESVITINEENVETRTLSIVNQYVQNIQSGLWGVEVLETFLAKKVTNAHDRAWVENKIRQLKA